MTRKPLPQRESRLDLRQDIRAALEPYAEQERMTTAVTAVMMTVLPHFELAFKRGEEAAKLHAGSRLVQENERLRRELKLIKKESV